MTLIRWRRVAQSVLTATATAAFLIPVPTETVEAATLAPLGNSCTASHGVRFCPSAKLIPSFDGTPLDADVTLPPSGTGPWPTIVLLHGLGGDKSGLEPNVPQTSTLAPRILPLTTHYSNIYYAQRGYAVLAPSARGFGQSCGGSGSPAAWTQTGACAKGFIRLADQRYEAHDVQYLLGRLVDQGITKPTKIGVTGFSYGGGETLQLAELKDKVRLPNGSFIPWRSPKGVPMQIGAAYGQWLWSDLISAVMPNGRFLDYSPGTAGSTLQPLGVMSQSYTHALYALAASTGYVAPPASDPQWDLTSAIAQMDAGEPYGASMASIAAQFRQFHGAVGIGGQPAPILLESGWNDDFFPPTESLREYISVRANYPKAFVALMLGGVGHSRDANRTSTMLAFNNVASAFFDEHLRGVGHGPANGSVLAYATTCPAVAGGTVARDAGPYRAASWAALHPHHLTFGGDPIRTVSSTGGDPTIGPNFDPIPSTDPLGTGDPCKTIPAKISSGTAVYQHRVGANFTMVGRPTIRAAIGTSGIGGQLVGRLWDVSPDGRQRLVTRAVYRLTDNQGGHIAFQLNGNGYTFAAGHILKLELAPNDAPTYRASTQPFSVRVGWLRVEVPAL